uniref:DNA mismatch repair protein Msh6 isoform X3 n=1 Tax=Myxine glutinosa TaxID=7769 RepID=UPI00358F3314
MAQKNTLLKYFSKVPTTPGPKKPPTDPTEVPTQVPAVSELTTRAEKKAKVKREEGRKERRVSNTSVFFPGDLVWARLEGHPWWPSMVCSHPVSGSHIRVRDQQQRVHVHFFGEPVTRGWVLSNACKPYEGSTIKSAQRGGLFFSSAPGLRQSLKQADSAIALPRKKRFEIPVSTELSDDDESGEHNDGDEASTLGNGTKEDGNCNVPTMEVDGETVTTEGKSDNGVTSERVLQKKRHMSSPQIPEKRHTKRRRIIDSCSGSDSCEESADDFNPEEENAETGSESGSHSGAEENSSDKESEPDSPVKEKRRKGKHATASSKVSGGGDQVPGQRLKIQMSPCSSQQNKANNTLLKSGALDTKEKGNSTVANGGRDDHKTWNHETLDWLKKDKRMDAKRQKLDHPDFDQTTLYVPERYLHECTPGVRRWWEIKATMFDTIIFYKVGKFYELYHMDAVVGVEELGLLFMKGAWAHSGFPEASLARYAAGLVQKGYKVARVEQTETPEMMEARCRNMARAPSKFDKVVRREVCRIITKGTQTCSVVDGTLGESDSRFLLAVKEKELSVDTGEYGQEEPAVRRFGICFVDSSVGRFCLGEFADDRHCSRFRTLIAHHVPVQVLIERGGLSTETQKIIHITLASALQEQLVTGSQFWDSSKTLKILAEEEYFGEKKQVEAGDAKPGGLPPVLQEMTAGSDTLGLSPAEDCELMLSALGACIFYLRKCLVDRELLSMGNFERYLPPDITSCRDDRDSKPSQFLGRHLILDGLTLANLDVLRNCTTGTTEGTLLERLDSCATPFGKRLLRQWLVAPLCCPDSINDRLDALEDLMAISEQVTKVKELLRKLPDLERLLSKIHSIGLRPRGGSSDPDSRAIFYEEKEYSRRKIADFLATIDGFQTAQQAVYTLKDCLSGFRSRLLRRVAAVAGEESDGLFPELTDDLKYWNSAFDHTKARCRGDIEPKPGFDPEYDQAMADVKDITQKLMDYLERQGKHIGCRKLHYWGTGRNRFQLEVPDGTLLGPVPDEYQLKSTKKGCKRYWTPKIERLLGKLTAAEERRTALQNDCMRRLFSHFDSSYQRWIAAVECVSVLDVLLSLANYSQGGGMVGGSMCRPIVKLPEDGTPWLELRESRHPCVFRGAFGDDFIPNDILIGMEDADKGLGPARCVLVTGPNMGGKSTLMRQAGLTVVLAQLGCFVPAESCFISPVDRVFTRLGASDRIMADRELRVLGHAA